MVGISKGRKSLLSSSCMTTSAALLATAGIAAFGAMPVRAQTVGCNLIGQACVYSTTGSPTWDGHSAGNPGTAGGTAGDYDLVVAFNPQLFDNAATLNSPVNATSIGGNGEQGDNNTGGAEGGVGGGGGNITISVGTQVSGTSQDTSSGISAMTIYSLGGEGGYTGKGNLDNGNADAVGYGGQGGNINATLDGFFTGNFRSVLVSSQGGLGGRGRDWGTGLSEQGADGATGGNAGTVTASFLNAGSNVNSNGFIGSTGVLVQSVGGVGGGGGSAEPDWPGAQGGDGGNGGNGNEVNVTIGANVRIVESADNDAALHLLSQGGAGGTGNSSGGSGGNGSIGGNGGNVTLTFNGSGGIIAANGTYAPGVLVQSLGGNGGNGGAADKYVIGPNGGSGGSGGTAGTVTVTGSGMTVRTGIYVDPQDFEGSPGLLAQSIGGGGGSGSDSKGIFAVGGDGGNAVNGNSVSVSVQSAVETFGFGSDGLAAQSIGGGGGKAGDASGTSVGFNYVIGGSGGQGGNGFTSSLTSLAGSTVLTHGVHSPGLLVQSIGGGGGQGGSAYSSVSSVGLGVSMSVGGSGGVGGDACSVSDGCSGTTAVNAGRITTDGSDSYGILAQSIGGGGGAGGASTAKAHVYAAEDVAISITAAIGGSGGQAGDGGLLTATNNGLITTTGEGGVGILAQSIGGGGGAGGDSSSSSTAVGGEYDVSATLDFGGKGKTGGAGGNATASNNGGVIVTTGESAAGMLVQSVGGGGGAGGAGDGQASSTGDGTKISTTLTMGGTGGSGGDGYGATANNIGGTIITLGDGAFGIGAQSIGGGGGAGGGAAGSSKGEYVATVTLGANGGNGGSTYHIDGNGDPIDPVNVLNDAKSTIVTFGADANGIVAQSIGGGGGVGGKAGSNIGTKKSDTAGGNGGANASTALAQLQAAYDAGGSSALNAYLGLNNAVSFTSSLLSDSTSSVRAAALGDIESDLDSEAQSKGETDDDNESSSIQLSVALGAKGGSGGSAGLVTVTNDGEIATLGNHSDAILAQAIGGGGGKGGAASTASSNDYSGNLSVGGSGGGGGYGGQVTVNNSGDIYTKGALAAGIVGESISGGGGIGGASASSISSNSKNSGDDDANDGAFKSLAVSVGGNGGTSYDSGQVRITSSGAISTAAHDSTGIIAQSIAGGGGIVKTLATDLEGAGGSASAKSTDYDIQFKFGGSDSYSSGGSGLVNVTTEKGGAITTTGDNSYGILAQSISGGGGLQLGGKPVGNSAADFFGSGSRTGSVNDDNVNNPNSGNSGLFVTVGDNITTSGNGAIGIFAQSIGGGGGIAGDTSWTEQFFGMSGGTHMSGSGGYIDVNVGTGTIVSTSGSNAPAIFLQSIGGGGGRITNKDGAFIGTAGGSGQGGAIDVTISGTVQATGYSSLGVFAQSQGDDKSNSPISVTVASGGLIQVGTNSVPTGYNGTSAGIYIDHGGTGAEVDGKPVVNTVTNNGTIQTYGTERNAVAVYSNAGNTQVINNGTLNGDVLLTNGGGTGCFTNNGHYGGGDKVAVGACGVTNNGVMDVRGKALAITGGFTNSAGGTLVLTGDFSNKSGVGLTIDGDAKIGGKVEIHPSVMRNATTTLATATGTMSLDPTTSSASDTHLYSFAFDTDGKALHVTPSAHFSDQASGFGANQRAVADNLQSLFDSGAAMDKGFARLGGVNGDADYSASLSSMAGKALGAFGAFRINSSRTFAANLYGGCSGAPLSAKETDSCVWGRVLVNGSNQKEGVDTFGYRANATAWQMGGQIQLSPDLALTGSMAYEHSRLRDADGSARVNGDALIGGVGLLYTTGALEVSGGADAAYGWYSSSRTVAVGGVSDQADAKPQQWQVGAHVRAAYSLPLGGSGFFRPFVEGHAIHVVDKSFTETGDSPFRLAVDGRADTALIGTAGAEIGGTMKLNHSLAIRPFASAAVAFGSQRDWITTARFADQPQSDSFDIKTAGPATLGRFTAGIELLGLKNMSLSVEYVPVIGKGYTSNSGLARLTYRF